MQITFKHTETETMWERSDIKLYRIIPKACS